MTLFIERLGINYPAIQTYKHNFSDWAQSCILPLISEAVVHLAKIVGNSSHRVVYLGDL
jgi:hypothetical protein